MTSHGIMDARRNRSKFGWRLVGIQVAIFVLSIGLTLALFFQVRTWEKALVHGSFERLATIKTMTLQREVDRGIEAVGALGGLFVASERVEWHEFSIFARKILARHPNIEGLEWAPRVGLSKRPAVEAAAREAGITDFRFIELDEQGRFIEAEDRKEYFPVYFLEPLKGNEAVLGLNLSAIPDRNAAMMNARDTGQIAVTGAVRLVQPDHRGRYGFVVFMPIYLPHTAADSPEARRASFKGFVIGIFSIDELIKHAFKDMPSWGITFTIADAHDPTTVLGAYIAPSTFRGVGRADGGLPDEMGYDRPALDTMIHLPGREWNLRFFLSDDFAVAHGQPMSAVTLGVGFLLSVFLCLLAGRTVRIRALNRALAKDIARRKEVEKALKLSRDEVGAILDNVTDGIVSIDANGVIRTFNPAAERIFAYSAGEVIGKNIGMLMSEPYRSDHASYISECLKSGQCKLLGPGPRELEAIGAGGRRFPIDLSLSEAWLGDERRFIGAVRDISERKRYQEKLQYQAAHDLLTGLPNRDLLHDRLQQAIAVAERNRLEVAVMLLDLDQFKVINDALGHSAGDALLKRLAKRLVRYGRRSDTVARYGGDEFVVVMDVTKPENLGTIARRLLAKLSRKMTIKEHDIRPTASIGISVYPQDGSDPETLLKNADNALHHAKNSGRNGVQFFTQSLQTAMLDRLILGERLRSAQDKGELLLHYQPKVAVQTGGIVGVEALVRWHSPALGVVPPAKFIPVAEENGQIVPIGRWVLETACAQNKAWQDAGLPKIPVAVNLSPKQLRTPNVLAQVGKALEQTGLEARYLELELTESAIMEQPARMFDILQGLKKLGVVISMDDFGTGYSSLGYLRRFPFDKLKIDQSFVRDIPHSHDDTTIALTIIAMARSLGLKVVAEGVETREQLEFMRQHACDEIQGYLFSRPVTAEEMENLLRNGCSVSA